MKGSTVTFNRGRVSRHAMARVSDVDRIALAAEVQTNWLPMNLGPMMLRPGLEHIGSFTGLFMMPFVYDSDDCALIEMGLGFYRVWEMTSAGPKLLTRPAVTASVGNGGFDTDLDTWIDEDETGAISDWFAGAMRLRGTGYNAAQRRRPMAIHQPGVEHGLRIFVERGPVTLRVGSSAGLGDLVDEELGAGAHSITFIPNAATVHIEFSNTSRYPALVGDITVEDAGPVRLPTFYDTADLLRSIRYQQINDILFIACDRRPPRKLERRANGSWSIVRYEPSDGPFEVQNVNPAVRLKASALNGAVTVTASRRYFRQSQQATLFRIPSEGQKVLGNLAGEAQFTDPIRIVGLGDGRSFSWEISGAWSGHLRMQRSIGDDQTWVRVEGGKDWTANDSGSLADDYDNVIAYYRIGFEPGEYTSGVAVVTLTHSGGSITGTLRVDTIESPTSATGVVLKPLGSTDWTADWSEGSWNVKNGFPSAIAEYEGRLWFAGRDRVWATVSDILDSFDPDFEGDAGTINRFLGGAGQVQWLLPMSRLLAGSADAEHRIGSTSIDEVVTPLNYNAKPVSTSGSAKVGAVKADTRGYFVQRAGRRLTEVGYQIDQQDYAPKDLTELCPEIGDAGFLRMAVQRHPETRVHCVRRDGTVAILVRNAAEDVTAWIDFETDGKVQDVCVLPGGVEDDVFYLVERNGTRRLEKWALAEHCRGGEISRCLDGHVVYDGDETSALSVPHLAGLTVAVWGDGADLGTYEVPAGGTLTLPYTVKKACAGLPYTARYKSARLINETRAGTTLAQKQRVLSLGLMLADTHWRGLQFGPDFDNLNDLPMDNDLGNEMLLGHDGAILQSPDQRYILGSEGALVWAQTTQDMVPFPGEWTADTRVCLVAHAPRPCTVLAAVVDAVTR